MATKPADTNATDDAAQVADQAGHVQQESDTQKYVTLDDPIKRAGQTISRVLVRKPQSGELRGVSLMDLANLDVNALITVIPRVTTPMIHKEEVARMDVADLMQVGAQVASFLATKEAKAAYQSA
jgi:hypothetical protein